MNATRELERAALAAHARGDRWEAFWKQHAEEVRQAEPYRHAAYRKLVNRLLSLVVSGDGGPKPFGPTTLWGSEPWEHDDAMQDAQGLPLSRVDRFSRSRSPGHSFGNNTPG